MVDLVKGTYVRSVALTGFPEYVARCGGDAAAILKSSGISAAALSDANSLIGWGALGVACEMAAQQLDEPDFGFDVALTLPEVYPNAIAPVLVAQEGITVGEWIYASALYWRYYTDGYTLLVLPQDDGGVVLRLEFPQHSFTPRHVMELTFASVCRLWRSIGDHTEYPAWIHFRHRQPANMERFTGFFGPGIAFEQAHYEIGFSPSQVNKRLGPSDDRKRALIDWLVRRRIETVAIYDQSMAQTVAIVISSILGAGLSNMEFVASGLNLSPKKLQRLLAQEGTSFSEVLNAVRERLALRLLTQTEVSIAQIAGLLDYAATAPFSLAVRRWYGMSPVAVRHRQPRLGAAPEQEAISLAPTDR